MLSSSLYQPNNIETFYKHRKTMYQFTNVLYQSLFTEFFLQASGIHTHYTSSSWKLCKRFVHAKTWQFLGYRLDQPHGMFLQSVTTCVNYMVYHAFLKLMHSGYILGELKEQTSHCFNVVCMCFILFISVSIALIECNRFS